MTPPQSKEKCPTVGHFEDFQTQYNEYRELTKSSISDYLKGIDVSNRFSDALNYTLSTEGKLFRPVFSLSIGDYLGVDLERLSKVSLLLEFIHVSSLIHDDLPSLDNDDLRRGKPSCHKVYGEGPAILLGDYLISEAYSLVTMHVEDGRHVRSLVSALSRAFSDLCLGQVLDLELRGKNLSKEEALKELENINALKTGALFELSAEIPIILSGVGKETADIIRTYSRNLGLLFQLSDDILDASSDVKSGNDKEINYIEVLGIEETELRAGSLVQNTISILNSLHDTGSEFMKVCVFFARGRKE